jgi:hypothetical protein
VRKPLPSTQPQPPPRTARAPSWRCSLSRRLEVTSTSLSALLRKLRLQARDVNQLSEPTDRVGGLPVFLPSRETNIFANSSGQQNCKRAGRVNHRVDAVCGETDLI